MNRMAAFDVQEDGRRPRSPTGSKGGKLQPVERSDDRAADAAAREAELLDAVAAGDRGAPLKELYHRYEGRLYGLGLRLLGDAGLAEELVQETFLRVWRNADRYDREKGAPSTFIFTIARRLAIDLWRRPSSRPFAESIDDEPGPDAVERMIAQLTVRDALDSLSDAHREVLELSYDRDLKQSEIAERLGIPLGTVKTRTYHALRSLKDALEERSVDG
jgi:RNA polymerase sigma-70 factor (ECF subfamily)